MRVGNVLSVRKYSNNFSSLCFSLLSKLSERIRNRELNHSSFLLSPDFLDDLARKRNACRRQYSCFKELNKNSRKYRTSFIFRSNHQNISRNSIWLVKHTKLRLGHKTRLHCSFAKPFPWSSTNRPNFLKSDLVFELFHGYKDLAWQSSWWSILFCVYVYIHWSKAVALFAQFLSSLPERNSTNERRPW